MSLLLFWKGEITMATYRVYFIDGRDGLPNVKMLEAESVDVITSYMLACGHEIEEIEEQA